MKKSAAFHCLFIATASVYAALVPIASGAQGTETSEAPAVELSIPQKRFVSDKLVLNVYAEAEQGSARVATIQTGDAVDELERSGNLVRIRLEDGREGWVGSNYLVTDAPAIVRLRELQRQQPNVTPSVDKASMAEIAQLKKENAALRGQVSQLQARAVTSVGAPPVAAAAECEQHTAPPAVQPPVEAAVFPSEAVNSAWGWLLALVFVGGASFAGGYQTLARRLRKKFGALKIY